MVVPHIGHIFLLSLIYAIISSFRIPSGAFIVASGCIMGTGFPARLISRKLGSECYGSAAKLLSRSKEQGGSEG
jgi:hypothetical protein